MKNINRGLKSILKNKIKTLIYLSIIILLATFAISSFLVVSAINGASTHLRRSIPNLVYVTHDIAEMRRVGWDIQDQMQGNFNYEIESVTREMIYEISKLSYVLDFEYSLNSGALSFDIERYYPDFLGELGNVWFWANMISLIGTSHANIFQLEMNIWELTSGRLFTPDEMNDNLRKERAPILISEGVAKLNDLDVGSVVTLYIEYFIPPEDAEIPENGFVGLTVEEIISHNYNTYDFRGFDFEVVGLFHIPFEVTEDRDIYNVHQYSANQFITPAWRVEEMNSVRNENLMKWVSVFNWNDINDMMVSESPDSFTARWLIDDLENFEAFRKNANAILPEFITIGDMSFLHRHITNSMQSINILAQQILVFSMGATIIILSLTILLFVRDRKHEIGIYLALGESKFKIVLQILFETTSVALVGLLVAIVIGSILSHQVSESLLLDAFLQSEAACPLETCWEPRSDLMFTGFANREMDFEMLTYIYDISLDTRTLLLILSVGSIVVIISTLIAVVYMSELKPKDILLQSKVG